MIVLDSLNGVRCIQPNSIVRADCLEVMGYIKDNSVDLLLTDLPYGETQNSWDIPLDLSVFWKLILRVCKENAAMVFTSQAPFDKILAMSKPELFRYEWIWQKNVSTGFMNAGKMPLKIHENVLVFYRKLPIYNPQFEKGKPYSNKRIGVVDTGENYGKVGIKIRKDTINNGLRFPKSIILFDREIGLHPTQKPVPLMSYFVRTYTNEGEVVLDPCMGSASTGVACVNENRSFIGIEKEANYFEISKKRLSTIQKKWTGG